MERVFQLAVELGIMWGRSVVSDQHTGLIRAIRQHFQGVTWQRCQTHFARNLLAATKALHGELHALTRACQDAPDPETIRILVNRVLEDFEPKDPKAMTILEAGFDDAMVVFSLPEKYRNRLQTA